MKKLILFTCLLSMLFFVTDAYSNKKENTSLPDHNITEWRLGEIISGPEVKLEELTGKVVMIEFWGRRCPPCLKSLPELAKLYRRYNKKGLVIIGIHAQGGTKEEILEVVKDKKVTYTICMNTSHGPIPFRGIPKLFIFNKAGKLAFDGRPGKDSEKLVKKLLKEKVKK